MADDNLLWIYLIFLIIPLSRIVPRLIKKWKSNNTTKTLGSERTPHIKTTIPETREFADIQNKSSPKTDEMKVLGELVQGTKNFEILQKKLELDSEALNSILEGLENKKLMRVQQKQGILGQKIELYPTEEGIKKYYS
ncbi:MAG: hypothetical protein K5793_01925 [Nitrosarchaeum sp.]|nr:hypothetical protein [Nitrosarchaeum sp.]